MPETSLLPWGIGAVAGSISGSETEAIEVLVALMLVATLVGLAAQRIRLPYTVALVLVGIGLHSIGWIPSVRLTQGLLMTVFLPALLFEAAIHVPAQDFRRMAPSLLVFAVPGVLAAALVTALVLQGELMAMDLEGVAPFIVLLLFGTVIAATDPISVVALFKQLGISRRLSVLVEGESLLNDGTAIVVFGIVLEAVRTGNFSVPGALVQFVIVAVGGLLIGAAVGLLASWATSLFDDHLIEIALTSVAAYGAFLGAERLHVSGVLAVVTTGLLVGNVGKKRGMSPQTRVSVLSFWEYIAFFINSILFLLLGLEVSLPVLAENAHLVVMAFIATLAARAAAVFIPLPLLRKMGQPFDKKSAVVLWWGGLRGGLSMVLVLSLPQDIPGREILVAMTFGVVILSVVVQGASMGFLLKKLNLVPKRTGAMRFLSRNLAQLKAIEAQRSAIEQLVSEGARSLPGLKEIQDQLEAEREWIVGQLNERMQDESFVEAATVRASAVREHLREVARDTYRKALDDNLIDGKDAAALAAFVEEGKSSVEPEEK